MSILLLCTYSYRVLTTLTIFLHSDTQSFTVCYTIMHVTTVLYLRVHTILLHYLLRSGIVFSSMCYITSSPVCATTTPDVGCAYVFPSLRAFLLLSAREIT